MSIRTDNKPILVTGATGYLGQRLIAKLQQYSLPLRVLTRYPAKARAIWPDSSVTIVNGDLTIPESLAVACDGIGTLYHLASHSSISEKSENDAEHHRITVAGTESLLQYAQANKALRLIFVSSVKAMGEGSNECLTETATNAPVTAYGQAKLQAERVILAAGEQTGLHVSIIRPPLIYGQTLSGSIGRMIVAIDRGRFPPLPHFVNKRSMVHVDDVVNAILLASENRAASGQVYLVTDGETYSTHFLVEQIHQALGKRLPRWHLPLSCLQLAARLGDTLQHLGLRVDKLNSQILAKLTGSAWYSNAKICRELGFSPEYTFPMALSTIVAAYRQHKTV